MSNLERPSTSCQIQRRSLADNDAHPVHMTNNAKSQLSRSYTFDSELHKQQETVPPKTSRSARVHPSELSEQSQPRLGRSLLSNDNWRQETMGDVRLNAKAIEQSDQNILLAKGKVCRRTMKSILNC